MSPTVLRQGRYRFFFFSREELREHIHVSSADGEAKFWLTPETQLCNSKGLTERELHQLARIIREHHDEFIAAWRRHFAG